MGNDRKIKLGIIGVGVMGRSHAKDVYNLEHAELAAICDVDASRADEVAGQYGVAGYYDAQAMFDHAGLDGVILPRRTTIIRRSASQRFSVEFTSWWKNRLPCMPGMPG